jgi:leucyl aminopeptidase
MQFTHTLNPPDFTTHSHWLVVLAADTDWASALPNGAILRQRHDRRCANGGALLADVGETRLVLAVAKPDLSTFERLTLGRKLYEEIAAETPSGLGIALLGVESPEAWGEAIVAAVLAAEAELPNYKTAPAAKPALRQIALHGCGALDFERLLAVDEGNRLARYLSLLPPNILTPAEYRRRIEELARQHGWEMQFYGLEELEKLGAGAFLAVTRGSADPAAGIVRLCYRPPQANMKIALVGKGICFDTGGYNVKSAKSMQNMHGDMQGSAVALGTLLALSRLRAELQIDCWLALANNHISPQAYTCNEVVRACNGVTIEIIHTDAEGRLVLADTLALASREQPDVMLDYATLTGACVVALGTRYSGVFCNRPAWLPRLIEAGQACGERVWPFPFDSDYDEALDSEVADIKQCVIEGEADHILAARFLSRFVDKRIAWIHMDLAASECEDGLAHIAGTCTGFGVRYTVHGLLDGGLAGE